MFTNHLAPPMAQYCQTEKGKWFEPQSKLQHFFAFGPHPQGRLLPFDLSVSNVRNLGNAKCDVVLMRKR